MAPRITDVSCHTHGMFCMNMSRIQRVVQIIEMEKSCFLHAVQDVRLGEGGRFIAVC